MKKGSVSIEGGEFVLNDLIIIQTRADLLEFREIVRSRPKNYWQTERLNSRLKPSTVKYILKNLPVAFTDTGFFKILPVHKVLL